MGDHELVHQVLEGNQVAIETLHEKYVNRIFNYILMQTSNYHDSEELLQDVFYKTATQLHTFKGKSSFETWIFKITRNTIIDYYRKNKKKMQLISMDHNPIENMIGSVESAETEVLRDVKVEEVLVAVNKLQENYRMVLYLRFIEGFSIKETGSIMGKTTLAVKALQRRARAALNTQIRSEVMYDE